MKKSVYFAGTTSILTLLAALPVASQEYYVGLGLGTVGGQDDNSGVTADFVSASGLAGVRFGTGSFFYGAEIDFDVPLGDIDTCYFPVMCGVDSTIRAKGLIGREFGGFDVFASVGYVSMAASLGYFGGSPDYPQIYSGLTYGIGAQIPVSERFDVRVEAMQDVVEFDNGYGEGNSWTNTTLRVAAIFTF